MKACTVNTRAVTYKPDFVGEGWVMETKGLRRPRFDLVWKLFKKYLHDNNLDWDVYMPGNHREIDECIEHIKNRGLLQVPKNLELPTRSRRKSSTTKNEDGKPRTKRRHPVSKDR